MCGFFFFFFYTPSPSSARLAHARAHACTSNRWPTATGSCKVKLEPSAPLTAPTDVDVLCLLSAYCTCVSQRRRPLKPRRACDALIPALILSEAGESRGKKAAGLPAPSPSARIYFESDTRGSQQRRRCRGAFCWQSSGRGSAQTVKTAEHRPPWRVDTPRRGQPARQWCTHKGGTRG